MNLWDYFPFGVVVVLMSIIVLGYVQSWLRRFFTWLKMREDNYLSSRSIDSIHTYFKFITFGLLVVAIVAASRLLPPDFQEPFLFIGSYFFIFNGFVVLSVFAILAILGSSAIGQFRKHADEDETSVIRPGILEFYELFIKYGMIILGFIVAVLVGIITIPEGDIRTRIFSLMSSDNLDTTRLTTDFLSLVIVLLVIFLLNKFIEIILDDFKERSKKFQPSIIDLIKAGVKYSLYWIALVLTLTIILEMIQFQQIDLVIIFIIAITLAFLMILGISPATRNAICGIVLLTTDSINKGDWVQIGSGNTGEVMAQGLIMTSLKTRTGDIIDLPNDFVLASQIHNYTKLGGTLARVALKLRTELSHDDVEVLLRKAAEGLDESSAVTADRAVLKIVITDLDKDSVEYTIDIWRKDPVTIEDAVSKYLGRFQMISKERNITVVGTRIVH